MERPVPDVLLRAAAAAARRWSRAGCLCGALAAARTRFAFELFAWVAMPEHVHLLLRPGPEHPVERILYHIKRPFSLWAIGTWRRSCTARLHEITLPDGSLRVWQKGGGFDRNVRDTGEFMREFIYIHRNPVKRGLAAAPADWAWSSARWWLGMRDGDVVPCDVMPGFEEEEFARMIREHAGGGAPDPNQSDGAG